MFECFNEAKGYSYLKQEGYSDIQFLKPRTNVRTPDLCGWRKDGWAFLEVKTLHESYDDLAYLTNTGKYKGQEKDFRKVQHHLTEKIQQRVTNVLESARAQLHEERKDLPQPIKRRIVFLCVWLDTDNITQGAVEELKEFVRQYESEGMEVVPRVMNPFLI